jgi:hypothetical protein
VNEALRWTLILGCLLLAILEAPQSSLVLVQDLRGPWRAELSAADPVLALVGVHAPARKDPTISSRTLKPLGAFASVAPEDVLGPDCSPPDRYPRHPVSYRFALLLAR